MVDKNWGQYWICSICMPFLSTFIDPFLLSYSFFIVCFLFLKFCFFYSYIAITILIGTYVHAKTLYSSDCFYLRMIMSFVIFHFSLFLFFFLVFFSSFNRCSMVKRIIFLLVKQMSLKISTLGRNSDCQTFYAYLFIISIFYFLSWLILTSFLEQLFLWMIAFGTGNLCSDFLNFSTLGRNSSPFSLTLLWRLLLRALK